MSFSESPRNLDVTVDGVTLKKVVLHSVATAFANNVLPVPWTTQKKRNKQRKNRETAHAEKNVREMKGRERPGVA